MAILWAENTYHFPTYLANAYCLKTNLPVTTSMRAPGVVQVGREGPMEEKREGGREGGKEEGRLT